MPVPAPARKRISAWLQHRAALSAATGEAGLWIGKRGRLTDSGITEVVHAVGADAGLPGLRPYRLRHTYATRLRGRRRPGPDPGAEGLRQHRHHRPVFPAGAAEVAGVVDRIFQP